VAGRNFNLVDEQWIPIAGVGLASLREIFANNSLALLGGNPMQKIALYKLFQAIAQAACTPTDSAAWVALKPEGMGEASLAYLEKWHGVFCLYGEKPFLQMPAIAQAEKQPFGALLPHIATGNTTVLLDLARERPLSNAEKALLVVVLAGFGFGGKKTDNRIVLTPGYAGKRNDKGKASTGKPGPSLGFLGYQHHFIIGQSLLESIWFNLLDAETLNALHLFPCGAGTPPWEDMPKGEDCARAKALRDSLMGRLVPLSKFFLLAEDGLHYSDGIEYADHKSGGFDPSIAVDISDKKPKALWADPNKQFWRDLPTLLAFMSNKQSMTCFTLSSNLKSVRKQCQRFGLWAGGIRVSSNAGEQYATGSDDFVESTLWLTCEDIDEPWFDALEREINELDTLSRHLYAAVKGYGREMKVGDDANAKKASAMFWQLCSRKAQTLVDACNSDANKELRPMFADFAREAYNSVCQRGTARQLAAWAANWPNTAKYLNCQ
jgi:CRISPR system Cascade subunit CasA